MQVAPLLPLARLLGSGCLWAASLTSALLPGPRPPPTTPKPRLSHPSLPGIESGPSGAAAPWRRAAVSKLSESGLWPPAPSTPQTRAARLAPLGRAARAESGGALLPGASETTIRKWLQVGRLPHPRSSRPRTGAAGAAPLTGWRVCGYILLRSRIIHAALVGCARQRRAAHPLRGPRGGVPGLRVSRDAGSRQARRLGAGGRLRIPRGRH